MIGCTVRLLGPSKRYGVILYREKDEDDGRYVVKLGSGERVTVALTRDSDVHNLEGEIIMTDTPILTQSEVKQYIAQTMLALRQDVSREMEADGEPLEITSDFYGVLYELSERFELEPGQQALACGPQVCRLYDPPQSPLVTVVVAADTPRADFMVARPQGTRVQLPVAVA
jgi:hypothetical protein